MGLGPRKGLHFRTWQAWHAQDSKVGRKQPREQSVLAQLVKSLSREEADELHVPSNALKRFRYLNRSGCTTIAGTDDVADFCLVKHAMDAVNIDKKSQVMLL